MTSQDTTRKPTAEENAKALAEAKQAEAEAAKALAETDKLRVEIEAAKATARSAAAIARVREIERDREERTRELELAADYHHMTLRFTRSVSEGSVHEAIVCLNAWRRTVKPQLIEIEIDSPGGSVFAGMALFDHIQAMKVEGWTFRTVARGMAASMGGILLQAGTERVVGSESYVLIHEISTLAIGSTAEIEDEVELLKKIQERVLDIFASRSGGKVSKDTLRRKWRRKDWWLSSDEAIVLGIADRIG